MEGQVSYSLWLVSLACLLVLANGSQHMEGLGAFSVDPSAASQKRVAGETLMEKLGWRSKAASIFPDASEEVEDAVKRRPRQMRAEKIESDALLAEEGEHLEDQYYRDSAENEQQELLTSPDREEEEERNLGDQDEDTERGEEVVADDERDNRRSLKERSKRQVSLESDLLETSHGSASYADSEENSQTLSEEDEHKSSEIVHEQGNHRSDDEQEEGEASRTTRADTSRTITDVSSAAKFHVITDDKTIFHVADKVRAFNYGAKEWQGAKVVVAHEDGTLLVDWDSGSIHDRALKAADAYKPPPLEDSGPYRFDGANAYNMLQEHENRVSGHGLTPSTQAKSTDIFDGYTLFDPSSLDS